MRIDLAVVFDGGQVEEVGGVVHRVVVVPEFLLPPGRCAIAGGLDFEILRRFGEARAGRRGGPHARVVRSQMPDRSAAHAEAADQQAVLVDGVVAPDGVERFEEVHFAGEFAGVAVAPVEVQHDGVARRELAGGFLARGDEVDLREGLIAAVEPGVEAPAVGRVGRIGRRHDEPVRLDALVDFGDVAAHHESGGGGPGSLSGGELGGALFALLQEEFGGSDLGGLEEFVVLEREADGLGIDLHVRQERPGLEAGDGGLKMREAGLKFGAIGGGNRDAVGWNPFDCGLRDQGEGEE